MDINQLLLLTWDLQSLPCEYWGLQSPFSFCCSRHVTLDAMNVCSKNWLPCRP